ncbi:Protein kinase domain-containing protein [Psidium guajava]|nr:Protein kinase domain-containing protein [Psidium guajava]
MLRPESNTTQQALSREWSAIVHLYPCYIRLIILRCSASFPLMLFKVSLFPVGHIASKQRRTGCSHENFSLDSAGKSLPDLPFNYNGKK